MRLLVTNDDGVDSVFMHELVRALIAAGQEVSVAAPLKEQSWTGASKSRTRPVSSEPCERGLGCPTWVVDGTPSDCVNIAIAHLLSAPPDAVVSGINIGLNASIGFILGSGTVAGACEGALHGIPGIAVSQALDESVYERIKHGHSGHDATLEGTLKASASHAARLIPQLVEATAKGSFIVHNLNFPYPCTPSATVRRTVPSRTLLPGLFTPRDCEGRHRLVFRLGDAPENEGAESDRRALAKGEISHTVLDFTKLGSI